MLSLRPKLDAYAFGLNAVSDGLHVHPRGCPAAARIACRRRLLADFGDLSELIKGGGSVKCCTQEIRPAPNTPLVPSQLLGRSIIVITTDHTLTHSQLLQLEDEHVAHNYHPLDVVVKRIRRGAHRHRR